MKALVMEAVGKPMVVKDVPEPKCPADGAIVRVEGSGICRSDWHLWQGDWSWVGFRCRCRRSSDTNSPGVVEEVGKDVKTLKAGAAWWCRSSQGCGVCEDCRTGHSNQCFGAGAGGYARYGSPEPRRLQLRCRSPKVSISSRRPRWAAATSPPFTASSTRAQVQADETVVVYGCGGVGLSAIQIASALGARVIAVDLDDRKLELAKKVGASDVINGKNTDPVKAVMDLTHGGANVSVDALGIATTCRNAVSSLRKRGRHIQIGLTTQGEKGEVALPVDQIVFKRDPVHRLAGDAVLPLSRDAGAWSSAAGWSPRSSSPRPSRSRRLSA